MHRRHGGCASVSRLQHERGRFEGGFLGDLTRAFAHRTGFSRGVATSAETAGTLGGLSDRHEALPKNNRFFTGKSERTVAPIWDKSKQIIRQFDRAILRGAE